MTYQDGTVIEWAGPPDSERPASVVTVGSDGSSSGGSSHDDLPSGGELPSSGGMNPAVLGSGTLALAVAAALLAWRRRA